MLGGASLISAVAAAAVDKRRCRAGTMLSLKRCDIKSNYHITAMAVCLVPPG